MSDTSKIVPIVGLTGTFTLATPFDTKISPTDKYTVEAVRSLRHYINHDKEVKKNLYLANGLTEEDWERDREFNTDIVSLQGEKGHWVHVPARFIIKYPNTNGIPYRTMMVAIGLPPMPADRSYEPLLDELRQLIERNVGVESKLRIYDTSRVSLVPHDEHKNIQTGRAVRRDESFSYKIKYNELDDLHKKLLQRIRLLENYIKSTL